MTHKYQVLGTIIASVLNYDLFCHSIGENPAINNKRSTYVPCDGRSILDSELEELTRFGPKQPDPLAHIAHSPDLRGRFLRGLNQFYNSGEGPVADLGSADPDGAGRRVGQYQPDLVGRHTHPIITADDGTPADASYKITGYGKHQGPTVATEPTGGAETRPRNIAVYYYIKIN